MCECVHANAGAHTSQRRWLDPEDPELQMAKSWSCGFCDVNSGPLPQQLLDRLLVPNRTFKYKKNTTSDGFVDEFSHF